MDDAPFWAQLSRTRRCAAPSGGDLHWRSVPAIGTLYRASLRHQYSTLQTGVVQWIRTGYQPHCLSYSFVGSYNLAVMHSFLPPFTPSMFSVSPLGGALLAIAASLFLVHRRRRNSRLPCPPGPKGYPVIGNMFDVPPDVPLWKAAMSIGVNYSK